MQNDLDQLFFVSNETRTAEPASIDNSAVRLDFWSKVRPQKRSPSLLDSIMNASVDESPDPANDRLPDSFLFEGSSESFSVLIQNDGSSRIFGPDEEFLVVTYQWRDQQYESSEPELGEAAELGRQKALEMNKKNESQPRNFVRSVVTYRDFQTTNFIGLLTFKKPKFGSTLG